MTTPEPQGERRMVTALHVTACNKCRRARGAALAGARGPRPSRQDGSGRCPHGKVDRSVWAPGHGPDADRPDEPPAAPDDPEERREGPI
ncbi:conserved hypothetical protein [Frankia canadensis]|uniref:Uncharacterized protein n=1 Tax=Frankia canadensis TaxID=1836972 RepID=A0A2I2L0V5_9ACTN|nr:conserved hypothetical protein [Frankia canadensis]SOU58825.1 conserved hypothetical protein [Frankia canadensis]